MIKKLVLLLIMTAISLSMIIAQEHNGKIIIKIKDTVSETAVEESFTPGSASRSANFSGIPIKKLERLIPEAVANKISSRSMSDYKPGLYLLEPEVKEEIPFEKALQMLKKNPNIEYAEPDYIVTLDTTTPSDPNMNELWGMTRIQANLGWDIKTDARDIIVAVIDTGVDYNHPDLAGNMIAGYDFLNNDADPMDDDSHGTHCAGTIGAVGNNNVGVAGVAWNVQIMPLKFIGPNGGSISGAIQCIDYAIANGADIMSNSWSGDNYSQALFDAVQRAQEAGILFIAAASNERRGRIMDNDQDPVFPACYDLDNIISVASTDEADNLSGFSHFGATTVDLGAPGSNIYSTFPNSSYGTLSGTSMATPHVAGAAALIKAINPNWDYRKIRSFLLDTVDPLADLGGVTVTGGRLNLYNALKEAKTEYVNNVFLPIINTILMD